MSRADDVVLVIHGGAGVPSRGELSAARERVVRQDLEKALRAGYAVIRKGGAATDAVVAAIVVLEDSPQFNAGKGAALNENGVAELDASIMDGRSLAAGAVAGVHRIRNPIELALAVMERSEHVMLIGDGAEAFGKSVGFKLVDPAYFLTDERVQDLKKAKSAAKKRRSGLQHWHLGTVGAVALDSKGRLAAGTSTGGTTNKKVGRVGDSPIIGAGTYADSRCGVSATGIGEYFIRVGVARDICARMQYTDASVRKAAQLSLAAMEKLGGEGGVIALDARGDVAMPFTTDGMYRGTVTSGGKVEIAIYAP